MKIELLKYEDCYIPFALIEVYNSIKNIPNVIQGYRFNKYGNIISLKTIPLNDVLKLRRSENFLNYLNQNLITLTN